MEQEVHAVGMIAATVIAAFASAGARLTTFRGIGGWDALWITAFVTAWLLLSAAMVNFDWKRWLW